MLSEIDSGLNLIERFSRWYKNRKNKNNKNKNFPYYFEDYTKHVTVYKNGNGIIINSSTLVVTDKEQFNKIYRKINIEDGKKDSTFPKLSQMTEQSKAKRFDTFGFWYYSDNNIITNISEFYWMDTDKNNEDLTLKANNKELRWFFDFNKGKIKENKPYKIVYVISIKGMYPVNNGLLDLTQINDLNSININSSEIDIVQDIKNFKYIVSFEDGITLAKSPICEICNQRFTDKDNQSVDETLDYNVLFNKYCFDITEPVMGSKIKVHWQFNSK